MDRDFLTGPVLTGQGEMALNWIRIDLDWIQGRNFLWWVWWDTETGCPKKLWMPHHWKCSRSRWMRLWATWPSKRCPCPWQGFWTRWPLKVPSNPNHLVILWSVYIQKLFLCLCITGSLRLEGCSWDPLVHPLCSGKFNYCRFPRTVSSWLLNASMDEDSEICLGNLFWCLTTLALKTYFLMFGMNFLFSDLCLLPLVLHWVPLRRVWSSCLHSLLPGICTHWKDPVCTRRCCYDPSEKGTQSLSGII